MCVHFYGCYLTGDMEFYDCKYSEKGNLMQQASTSAKNFIIASVEARRSNKIELLFSSMISKPTTSC